MQYFLAVHLLMSVLFAIFFLRFIMDVYGNGSPFMSMPLRTTFAVCMSVIPVMLLFSPEVLYGIPRMNIRDASASQAVPFSPETDPTAGELMEPHPNPMSPGVPEVPDRFNPLAERILSVIAEQKLYLDPDFSLDDLSRTMGVPKHHLYYCFKVIHRTYFTRLRAEFRVRHAQSMLREGYAREVTLDAIGLASGFSSATAFRKAFREIAGMSPRDFQRSIEQTGNS
jgi:AraC-like DNA-binding protein